MKSANYITLAIFAPILILIGIAGFLIPAIRYPTVPRHAARLRVALSAAHADKDIDALNRALAIE